jgi:uncharacterized membrane protein (DUF441 family)
MKKFRQIIGWWLLAGAAWGVIPNGVLMALLSGSIGWQILPEDSRQVKPWVALLMVALAVGGGGYEYYREQLREQQQEQQGVLYETHNHSFNHTSD